MSEFWKDKRVLVTGGNGFLGSHVVDRLKKRKARVYAPRSAECDFGDHEATGTMFRKVKPQIVIHLAAKCGGIGANAASPVHFYLENALMGQCVIWWSNIAQVDKLVLIGTTCSYPANAPLPLKEEDLWNGYPEATNAPYGIAKRTLLTMAQAYRQQYGLNSIYLIPANLYGLRDNFDLETSHVIPAIIRKCVQAVIEGQETITLWGDGTPTREFLYVEDCAEAILLAAERYDGAEPVNIGTGVSLSIDQVAGMCATITDFKGWIQWDVSKPNGQPRRVLDISRMRELLEWYPPTDLWTGLKKTVDWYFAYRGIGSEKVSSCG